jgi:hypothetical protein
MSTQDFLNTQIRLLIAQFGRRSVLETFAAASGVSPDQIIQEIEKLQAKKRGKESKPPKSLEELIANAAPRPEAYGKIIQLGHLYEAKHFLPNLRDAETFFRRYEASPKKYKSRKDALPVVLKVLSSMPQQELEILVDDLMRSPDQSDYAILAKQLMGKSQ